MSSLPRRGEVWWCEVPDKHRRPVVLLSRNAAIFKLRRVIAAPCSTVIRNLVTEVHLEPEEDPVRLPCVVQLDSMFSVRVGNLTHHLGKLSDERMHQVCEALAEAVVCRWVRTGFRSLRLVEE